MHKTINHSIKTQILIHWLAHNKIYKDNLIIIKITTTMLILMLIPIDKSMPL